ncbi:hypothetical protein CsatA_030937 [Cannabis sativa]
MALPIFDSVCASSPLFGALKVKGALKYRVCSSFSDQEDGGDWQRTYQATSVVIWTLDLNFFKELNVVSTRSGSVDNSIIPEKFSYLKAFSFSSALKTLAQPPCSQFTKKVFVNGDGQGMR